MGRLMNHLRFSLPGNQIYHNSSAACSPSLTFDLGAFLNVSTVVATGGRALDAGGHIISSAFFSRETFDFFTFRLFLLRRRVQGSGRAAFPGFVRRTNPPASHRRRQSTSREAAKSRFLPFENEEDFPGADVDKGLVAGGEVGFSFVIILTIEKFGLRQRLQFRHTGNNFPPVAANFV